MSASVSDDDAPMEVLIAQTGDNGRRVDKFISANAPDNFSRARVQALVRTGHVLINGAVPKGTSQRIKAGDRVEFRMPPPVDAEPEPEDIPLDILFEDDEVIVINKPVNMVVHPSPGNWSGTLVNALLFHCGNSLAGIGGVKRPGIVHRLDKDTTGVMVVAKTYNAHQSLSAQFADHGRNGPLKRSYLALCWGMPTRNRGSIEAHLGRHPQNRLKRAVVAPDRPDAKHAVTHFKLLKAFGNVSAGEAKASLIECELETGRTHQIRVHLAHAGHPLIGDKDYGQHLKTKSATLPENLKVLVENFHRQALHAAKLGFTHPKSGEFVEYFAQMPPDFAQIISGFEQI